MYYYLEVNIPPNTSEDSPIIKTIKLGEGMLDFIDIGFPDWSSRLARCRILYNTIQLLPWNRDNSIAGDNYTLHVPLEFNLSDEPYEIELRCFNLDDTFQHQLSFGFSVSYGVVEGTTDLQALGQYGQVQ